jgi:uncharacterized protein (DUF1330 family)
MQKYIDADFEAGKNFYINFHQKGKIVMLNLLKFRQIADYSDFEDLKPTHEISGKEAYELYMKLTLPELKKAGSKLIYYGKCQDFLIGPTEEKWDAMLIVEHESAEKFIAFAQNEEYLKTIGHRNAALEDARLLPSTEINL